MNPPASDFKRIAPDVKLGRDVRIFAFVNLYGCEIGDETRIGTFVEIQKGARIGDRCKISSHTFICEGVAIKSEVFVGHGVTFINDAIHAQQARLGSFRPKRIGIAKAQSSSEALRVVPVRRCWRALRSGRTPSLTPAASSPRMCLRTPPLRAIPQES